MVGSRKEHEIRQDDRLVAEIGWTPQTERQLQGQLVRGSETV